MRRKVYPQIDACLPVVIAGQDGVNVEAQTLQTSGRDLALQCNTSERNRVTPGGSLVRDGRPVELLVSLRLPVEEDGAAQVAARCKITYSRRVAKDICHIGLRYLDFENDGGDRLLRFIESRMGINVA